MKILDKLSAREKKIAYTVVALLILVFGYRGIWRPFIEKLTSMDGEIFTMQLKLRKAKTFILQREQVMEEAKKYPNLEQMDAGSDEQEIARLLNLLEQKARRLGVSISDVKPNQLLSDKISKRFMVELNAECELGQLVDFIYELQNAPERLKIDRIEVATKEDKSAVLRSSFVVTRVVVK